MLVRPFWPQLQVTAEIEAAAPHQRVRQLVGRDWAKSALVPDHEEAHAPNEAAAQEVRRRLKNSLLVWATVCREARETRGQVLVVAQKAVRERWEASWPVPRNVDLAHHNAVAGRDQWGPGPGRPGVAKLVVVGRTLPRIDAVERLAGALTGAAVGGGGAASRYERRDAVITLRNGSTASTEADVHPDPVAEAIRWQICEGELVQVVGRGRGVNRGADNPLDVLVLTNRPLPLLVEAVVTWEC